jgi:hypothetical protein
VSSQARLVLSPLSSGGSPNRCPAERNSARSKCPPYIRRFHDNYCSGGVHFVVCCRHKNQPVALNSELNLNSLAMDERRYLVGRFVTIQTEIQTGITFARVALSSRSASKTARNTANAHKAYDTARRWAQETLLSRAESKEIADQLQLLKAELAKLNKRSG